MPAGRPSKPLELKILQGTDRADRINNRSPQYTKIKRAPSVPIEFKKMKPIKYAKQAGQLWRRLCMMLAKVELLDEVNIDLIVLYVREVITYRQANEIIDKLGLLIEDEKKGLIPNPARRIATDAMKNIVATAREFGFTPSTRQKIITDFKPTPKKIKSKNTPEDIANSMEI